MIVKPSVCLSFLSYSGQIGPPKTVQKSPPPPQTKLTTSFRNRHFDRVNNRANTGNLSPISPAASAVLSPESPDAEPAATGVGALLDPPDAGDADTQPAGDCDDAMQTNVCTPPPPPEPAQPTVRQQQQQQPSPPQALGDEPVPQTPQSPPPEAQQQVQVQVPELPPVTPMVLGTPLQQGPAEPTAAAAALLSTDAAAAAAAATVVAATAATAVEMAAAIGVGILPAGERAAAATAAATAAAAAAAAAAARASATAHALQPLHNLDLLTCEDYFRDLLYRVEVMFIDKTAPADVGFTLELSQRMTYDQMASAVGHKINCEPNKIQFFKCQK